MTKLSRRAVATAAAHSDLGYVDAQVSPVCHPAAVTFLKVYPPGGTTARNAFFPLPACTGKTSYLTTGLVRPGG